MEEVTLRAGTDTEVIGGMLVEGTFESSAPFSLFHPRCCDVSDLPQPILTTAPQTGQLTTDKPPKSVKINFLIS